MAIDDGSKSMTCSVLLTFLPLLAVPDEMAQFPDGDYDHRAGAVHYYRLSVNSGPGEHPGPAVQHRRNRGGRFRPGGAQPAEEF